MYAAIILAAGESERMRHGPKANLMIRENSFLSTVAGVMKEAGVDSIYVVLGKHADIVKNKNSDLNVHYIINKEYKKGQLSSLKAALDIIPEMIDSIIVHLVDHPLIRASTVHTILESRKITGASIIIPTFKQKRGHPVLFGSEVFSQLLQAPLDVGARAVVWNNADRLQEIETDDEGILININTPDDYAAWCSSQTSDNR